MSVNAPIWVCVPVILLATIATLEDLRTRRIPNLVTLPALLLAIVIHLVAGGPSGALTALGAGLLVAAVLLPGWLMGFMGAGDVKLMAAIAAWLGSPGRGLYAVLFSLVAGGILSIVVALRRGILLRTLRSAALLVPRVAAGALGSGSPPETTGVRIPKALAFLAGSLFALWWRA
jgi:prepilin peptidase CpaA